MEDKGSKCNMIHRENAAKSYEDQRKKCDRKKLYMEEKFKERKKEKDESISSKVAKKSRT